MEGSTSGKKITDPDADPGGSKKADPDPGTLLRRILLAFINIWA
jgi:hypothetical protein